MIFVGINNNVEQKMPEEGQFVFCVIGKPKKLFAGYARNVKEGAYNWHVETVQGKKVHPYLSDVVYNNKLSEVHISIGEADV